MSNDISAVAPTGKFPLGELVATPRASAALAAVIQDVRGLLACHVTGDWGDLCAEDKKANDEAIASGDRILSANILRPGVKIWIATEADRSRTCVLP